MTEITIMCPKCQNIIKIQIKTIDDQRLEIQRLKNKVFELENKVKTNDMFGGIFGGTFK